MVQINTLIYTVHYVIYYLVYSIVYSVYIFPPRRSSTYVPPGRMNDSAWENSERGRWRSICVWIWEAYRRLELPLEKKGSQITQTPFLSFLALCSTAAMLQPVFANTGMDSKKAKKHMCHRKHIGLWLKRFYSFHFLWLTWQLQSADNKQYSMCTLRLTILYYCVPSWTNILNMVALCYGHTFI